MKTKIGLILLFLLPLQALAQNIIIVAPTGGDYTSPVDAASAIGTVLPSATFENRYLIKLMPGVYEVDEMIKLQPYVSIQGSGRETTMILGDVPGVSGFGLRNTFGARAVIAAASYSEISELTVTNGNVKSSNYVISMRYVTNSVLRDITAMSTGKSEDTVNWKTAIWVESSKGVRLTHVSAKSQPRDKATCTTTNFKASEVLIEDSEFTSSGCSMAVAMSVSDGAQVEIYNTRLIPVDVPVRRKNALSVTGTSERPQTVVKVKNSTLAGRLIPDSGASKLPSRVEISFSEFDGEVSGLTDPVCFQTHDRDLNSLNRSCY